jgi:hypothetical protein
MGDDGDLSDPETVLGLFPWLSQEELRLVAVITEAMLAARESNR